MEEGEGIFSSSSGIGIQTSEGGRERESLGLVGGPWLGREWLHVNVGGESEDEEVEVGEDLQSSPVVS